VARLGVVHLIGEVLDMCVQIHQDFFVLLALDLRFGYFEQNFNRLITSIIGGLGGHLSELLLQLSGVHVGSGHVLGAIPDLPHVLMRLLERVAFLSAIRSFNGGTVFIFAKPSFKLI